MDVLITGGAGQVGLELLAAAWPSPARLHAPDRQTLDLTDARSVEAYFAQRRFDAVVNAAAYTAVDRAEDDAGPAFAVNALGVALLAEAARRQGAAFIQVSTDYVFDGSGERPYGEDDPTHPLGVYGASKRAGELAALSANGRSVVLRTAWVMSPHRANFLKTMLRLASERDELRVVGDQIGSPTSATDIASAIVAIVVRQLASGDAPSGVYHFVNAGQASWAEVARRVLARSAATGGPAAQVQTITTAEFPTRARRPAWSVLSTERLERDYDIAPRPWTEALDEIVDALSVEWTQ